MSIKIATRRVTEIAVENDGKVLSTCLVAGMELPGDKPALFLYRLETRSKFRRQGHASAVMSEAKMMAQRMNVPLFVLPQPFGDEPLGVADLEAWYESLGFKGSLLTDADGVSLWGFNI